MRTAAAAPASSDDPWSSFPAPAAGYCASSSLPGRSERRPSEKREKLKERSSTAGSVQHTLTLPRWRPTASPRRPPAPRRRRWSSTQMLPASPRPPRADPAEEENLRGARWPSTPAQRISRTSRRTRRGRRATRRLRSHRLQPSCRNKDQLQLLLSSACSLRCAALRRQLHLGWTDLLLVGALATTSAFSRAGARQRELSSSMGLATSALRSVFISHSLPVSLTVLVSN
jgi:hypothetical protein